MIDWSSIFAKALPYQSFLDRHASPPQRVRWDSMHQRFLLTPSQQSLLGGFVRRMPVLCLAGAWCGDCINQCPVFDHFACAAPIVDLRFIDRDANSELRDLLSVNGGQRVPVVVFLSEDWFEVSRYGDRTISIYRQWPLNKLAQRVRLVSFLPRPRLLPPALRNGLSNSSGHNSYFASHHGYEVGTMIEQPSVFVILNNLCRFSS